MKPILIASLSFAVASFAPATPSMALPELPVESPNHLYLEGPDTEPETAPDTVIDVITDARWSCSEAPAVREFRVPKTENGGAWDRVMLQVESFQTGDPWDRLLVAAIEGAEVLRATTPRTRMLLRKDVTAYSSLLQQGELAEASLSIGSYVGSIEGRLRLEFYDDEPTAKDVTAPASAIASPMLTRHIRNTASQQPTTSASVVFPATAAKRALIDVFTSGHGAEEFWFDNGPLVNVGQRKVTRTRVFHIFVDGTEVGTFTAMPYVYALLGFGNDKANTACSGNGTSHEGDRLHPLMWWTAHKELDRAGIHGGVGEIPQYRIVLEDPAVLDLLTGNRIITVSVENIHNASGVWITSLSALLYS